MMLNSWFVLPETECGVGFFNAVLNEYLRDNGFDSSPPVHEKLRFIAEPKVSHEGRSYADCVDAIDAIVVAAADSLTGGGLKYPKERAEGQKQLEDMMRDPKKAKDVDRELQNLGDFDTKSSSWVKAPAEIRKLGGALYGDRRFGRVFVYHNGAQSYYSGRAFRGSLKV